MIELQEQGDNVRVTMIIDFIMALLLIISIVVNCSTLDKPLVAHKRKPFEKQKIHPNYGHVAAFENHDEIDE